MTAKRSIQVELSWHHYLALSAITLSLLGGLLRFVLYDRLDSKLCDALLTKGSWLDDAHRNWQPAGCMLHSYQAKDASRCLASRRIVFAGDSVARTLYFQFMHLVDSKLPTAPTDGDQKHADHSFVADPNITLDFIWDPFLNTSSTVALIDPRGRAVNGSSPQRPSVLVFGSGLWYLRYADSSGGLPAWQAMVESHIESISAGRVKLADEVIFLPVEHVVPEKLSPERYNTIQESDIDAMNVHFHHRIKPSSVESSWRFFGPAASVPVSLPLVFNQLLDDSLTVDGLHFSDSVVEIQANILLNLRCNKKWPKTAPMDKTCCRGYPWPSAMHSLILLGIALYTCASFARFRAQNTDRNWTSNRDRLPVVVFGAAVCMVYLADRTPLWLKEQKQFNPWAFAFLGLASLLAGLATVRRSEKDMGFLNRDQSDEWKGWMQIAILLYHYFGASRISGIYNPIRVLVAAYLFMTGYGHTTFYLKRADFGFHRIAQVMVRLNLLTITLAYTMNTDYLSYYFTPLVSMWFLIIYITLAIGSQFNDNTLLLVSKIVLSMAMFAVFMARSWLLELVFDVLKQVFNITWSAREWTFRVTLDQYIVYFGMFTAIAVIKIREHHLTDHPSWPSLVKIVSGCSILVLIWFFGFELSRENKFAYNAWHPYISFLPVIAFVILRNTSSLLRSYTSQAFAFIGKCSLETFIIQFHFWLAGDTKGILLIIPGTKWRPLNVILTTFVFIYVSHQVAWATGEITSWICDQPEKTLPTTVCEIRSAGGDQTADVNLSPMPFAVAGEDCSSAREESCAPEPDTQTHSQRSVEELSQPGGRCRMGVSRMCWQGPLGVKGKVGVATLLMWIANILWASD